MSPNFATEPEEWNLIHDSYRQYADDYLVSRSQPPNLFDFMEIIRVTNVLRASPDGRSATRGVAVKVRNAFLRCAAELQTKEQATAKTTAKTLAADVVHPTHRGEAAMDGAPELSLPDTDFYRYRLTQASVHW